MPDGPTVANPIDQVIQQLDHRIEDQLSKLQYLTEQLNVLRENVNHTKQLRAYYEQHRPTRFF